VAEGEATAHQHLNLSVKPSTSKRYISSQKTCATALCQ